MFLVCFLDIFHSASCWCFGLHFVIAFVSKICPTVLLVCLMDVHVFHCFEMVGLFVWPFLVCFWVSCLFHIWLALLVLWFVGDTSKLRFLHWIYIVDVPRKRSRLNNRIHEDRPFVIGQPLNFEFMSLFEAPIKKQDDNFRGSIHFFLLTQKRPINHTRKLSQTEVYPVQSWSLEMP